MSARRPSEVVRAYTRTFAAGGVEAAARLWDPQIEWLPLEARDTHAIRGRGAMRRYYAEWVDTMVELGGEVGEVVFEDDERVAVKIRSFGRGRVSGVPVSASYFVACLVKDGRIVVGREYATREEALDGVKALRA
jgi:ketosteroid isomerase-like protein